MTATRPILTLPHPKQVLVSRTLLARRSGRSRSTVWRHCTARNGPLRPAVVGDKIDLYHEATRHWLGPGETEHVCTWLADLFLYPVSHYLPLLERERERREREQGGS